MQRIRTNKFECTCKVCNKKFFAKTTLAEICSTECRNYNRTKHLTYKRKCIICGKDFETVSHNRVLCGAEECQKKYGCLRTKKYNETHPKEHKNRVCKTQEENNLRMKNWREAHIEYLKEYHKNYRITHKEKIRADYKNRIENDINFRMRQILCKRLQRAVKKEDRTQFTMDLLGCTIEEFRAYLESKFTEGMTWDNYGKQGWVIDHIIPCRSFDLTKIEEQKKCFNYKNMQPLWNTDNQKKSDLLPNGKRAREIQRKSAGKPITSGCLDDSE